MNHQDRRLLIQRYGLSQKEVEKVFNMVRSGKFTTGAAVKFVIKDRKAD